MLLATGLLHGTVRKTLLKTSLMEKIFPDGSNLWKDFLLSTSINCLLSIYVTVTESHSSRVMRFVQAMIDLRGEAESLLNLGQKDLLEELLVGHGLEVVNH